MTSAAIPAQSPRTDVRQSLSLGGLGALLAFLLLANGLVFRTYTGAMNPPGMEDLRLLGLFFLLAEVAVIFLAMRDGFSPLRFVRALPMAAKLCLGLFIGSFWISGWFVSPLQPMANLLNIGTLIHLLFAAALTDWLQPDQRGVTRFAGALGIGMALFVPMIAYMFLNHPPLSSMPDGKIEWQMIIPGFISVRMFGAFCGAVLAVLLGVTFAAEERRAARPIHYLAVTMVLALMIWSGTRAAVVGVLAALAIVLLFYRVRPSLRTCGKLAACLLVATLLAIALVPYGDPVFMLFHWSDVKSADEASGGRFALWVALAQAWLDYPWLGAGPAASSWLTPADMFPHIQPHNAVLQFLLNWGVIGALPALALLGWAAWRAHRIVAARRWLLPVLMMTDALLVMSLFDGIFFFARDTMMVMAGFAIIFAAGRAAPETALATD